MPTPPAKVVAFPAQPPASGRPTTLTADLLAQIEEVAETGLKNPQIYALLGIPKQTWSDWINPAVEHFQADLADTLSRARAKLALRLIRQIPNMEKGWQAPVWLLTQHFPGDYSRPNADTSVTVNANASANALAGVRVTEAARSESMERVKAALAELGLGSALPAG